jgi:predicted ATPase/DNA-binding XRE family transcriptional regulator
MCPDSAFGKWVKQRRKSLDATQDEFARRIGCTVSLLQKIETGARRPSRELAALIATALETAPSKRAAFIAFARDESAARAFFCAPNNLPAPTTPLIGRASDVAVIRKRILRDDTRLLTLVGPPGIGKTRLALAVAQDVRDCFDDGVFFVALAPITDSDLFAPTILRALDLREGQPRASFDRLTDYLRDKQIILILDNLEQIITVAARIAQVLAACPRLKILATSRIALRVRAERQFPVPPLGLPNLSRGLDVTEFARYPALELFCDRAQAVNPDFAITPENALTIAQICQHLDGLPLAIELIAARAKILSLAEILGRVSGKFLLQSDGLRDVDERQRTLKNAIEWSYNLLTRGEQTLFARLAVFAGGWTLDAAEQVCGVASTLDALTALVNQNLAKRHATDSETWFTLLELIREHALEKLRARDEMFAMQHAHALYFVARAENRQSHAFTQTWLAQMEREHTNLRAALKWLLDAGKIELAARLAIGLAAFWSVHSRYLSEGRDWLDQVLRALENAALPARTRAQMLNDAGTLAYLSSDYSAARAFSTRALACAHEAKDRSLIAYALFGLSNVAMNTGDYTSTAMLVRECLTRARALNDPWLVAMTLNNAGEVARLRGDWDRAEEMFREGATLLEQLDEKGFVAILLDGVGTIAQYRGEYARAYTIHTRALALASQVDDRRVIALALEKIAGVASAQNQCTCAARLLGAADALRATIQSPVESIDRADYDRFLAATRAGLDREAFAARWAEGRALTMDEAIAFALTSLTPNNYSAANISGNLPAAKPNATNSKR